MPGLVCRLEPVQGRVPSAGVPQRAMGHQLRLAEGLVRRQRERTSDPLLQMPAQPPLEQVLLEVTSLESMEQVLHGVHGAGVAGGVLESLLVPPMQMPVPVAAQVQVPPMQMPEPPMEVQVPPMPEPPMEVQVQLAVPSLESAIASAELAATARC
jgi:hypothetical protein